MIVKCTCGNTIPREDIEIGYGCNEFGEDYGTVEAMCPICLKDWEFSDWGEWASEEQAIEFLIESIKESEQ